MPSSEFRKIIYGEIKHVKQQERRDMGQPLGFTSKRIRVVSELPENLIAPETLDSVEALEILPAGQLEELQRKLEMVDSNPKHVRLLWLVWIDRLSTKDAAKQLGLDYDSARTIVFRAKKKWRRLFGDGNCG